MRAESDVILDLSNTECSLLLLACDKLLASSDFPQQFEPHLKELRSRLIVAACSNLPAIHGIPESE